MLGLVRRDRGLAKSPRCRKSARTARSYMCSRRSASSSTGSLIRGPVSYVLFSSRQGYSSPRLGCRIPVSSQPTKLAAVVGRHEEWRRRLRASVDRVRHRRSTASPSARRMCDMRRVVLIRGDAPCKPWPALTETRSSSPRDASFGEARQRHYCVAGVNAHLAPCESAACRSLPSAAERDDRRAHLEYVILGRMKPLISVDILLCGRQALPRP